MTSDPNSIVTKSVEVKFTGRARFLEILPAQVLVEDLEDTGRGIVAFLSRQLLEIDVEANWSKNENDD